MTDRSFLITHGPKSVSKITDQIKKINLSVSELPIVKILIQNPYEQLVPFNIWFHHPSYKIVDHFENNQHIRSRNYAHQMLTPLARFDNPLMKPLDKFIHQLSLYQPFYPETFFQMYDFLSMGHLSAKIPAQNILHIGRENRLGSLEAMLLYGEKNQQTYLDNTYHAWLSGNESYDPINRTYKLSTPPINYLAQAYKLTFLKSISDDDPQSELILYDFVSIDVNHTFDSIFKWNEEELDLHANLFYLLKVIKHLKKSASVVIKINLIGSTGWNFLIDIAVRFFSEHVFVRPTTTHPLNSEIYLYLNNFNPSKAKTFPLIFDTICMNLYRQKYHQIFFLNWIDDTNIGIDKYLAEVDKWIGLTNRFIDNVTETRPLQKCEILLKKLDLVSVRELTNTFEPKVSIGSIRIPSTTKFKIKPYVPDNLYVTTSYQKLIKYKAKLNYYKRVMDTKPSKIFNETRFHVRDGTNLITWEHLTDKTDLYKNLRFILKKQYGIELMTNAWIKMFEMLNFVPDLVSGVSPVSALKSFHLCEAPGAFISALNYYLAGKSIDQWEWYAQTLKKINTNDVALDDHYNLIKLYPNNWIFGDKTDNSGDITHSAIIKSYAKNKLLQNIDFMTADAGIPISPNELNEQETKLAKINMGQIICILACLSKGKNAIFKTFLPMTEPLTVSMMYLLSHLFESVSMIKPIGSHGCNSEIYVVLKNYKLINKSDLNILYDLLDDHHITSKSVLFETIDKLFLESYTECVSMLTERQIRALSRNYYYYYNYDKINELQGSIEQYTNQWFATNPVSDPKKLLTQSQSVLKNIMI